MGADFYYSLDTIKSRLGANAAPIMLPIGAEQFYEGYIDLVTKKHTNMMELKNKKYLKWKFRQIWYKRLKNIELN